MSSGFHSFFMREHPDVVFGFADVATLSGQIEIIPPASMTSTGMGTLGLLIFSSFWGIGAAQIVRSAMSMMMEPLDFLMSFRSSQVGVIANGAGGCWCSLPATLVPPRGRTVRILPTEERAFVTPGCTSPIFLRNAPMKLLHATGRWHSCDRRGCGHLCLGIFHRRQRWDQRPPEATALDHPVWLSWMVLHSLLGPETLRPCRFVHHAPLRGWVCEQPHHGDRWSWHRV